MLSLSSLLKVHNTLAPLCFSLHFLCHLANVSLAHLFDRAILSIQSFASVLNANKRLIGLAETFI